MEDFPGNSRVERNTNEFSEEVRPNKKKAPEKLEEKKIERVVEGEVIRRKKPLGKRFKETFVGGDAKSVWGYVVLDVLIPAFKDMVADATSQGIEKMLFGEVKSASRRGGGRRGGANGYVEYNRYSSSNKPPWKDDTSPKRSRQARAQHNFDDIVLGSRGEAEEVIDRMIDILSKYEQVTVADMLELVGLDPEFTDQRWGWTDLRGADIDRVRGGYLLDLPRPEPLN